MTDATTRGEGVVSSDIDPFSDEALADPWPVEEALRETAGVVWLEKHGVYACARFDEVHRILADSETFSSAAGVGMWDIRSGPYARGRAQLLEMDPPDHTRYRSVHNKVLNPGFVRGLKDEFGASARDLVAPLIGAGTIDGIRDIAVPYPLSVFPDMIGVAEEGRENLLPAAALTFNDFGPDNEVLARSREAGQQAQQWLIAQASPGAARPGGVAEKIHEVGAASGLEPSDTLSLVFGLLSAGLDTTMHGLGWALHFLATNPDQWQKLKDDPSLARSAFEEAVRLGSPVKWFGRHTTREVQLGDAVIPADSHVIVFLGAANRDPRKWDDPERYDILRTTSGHVGFGAGVHSCVGQMVARMEGQSLLGTLATEVDRIELRGEPTYDISNSLRGLHTLPVALTA
ncbi:MAG TPA: cytochrome P450 [Microbacterium sp.]|nr:cytochrome P450 [Microbacterium sp.]